MLVQNFHPWFPVFDELLVNDPSEWQDVRRLAPVPVSTFPKTFGLGALPPIPTELRTIDVFASGVWGHPFHPDKARLLNQVLSIPDHKVMVINGHLSSDWYNTLLGKSKICFGYIRFKRVISTRGMDALVMGCAPVVQKNSMLLLYSGKNAGVLTYDSDQDDLAPAILKGLADWPQLEKRVRMTAQKMRDEFALPRLTSEYLRFATFLAAKPRGARRIEPSALLRQKRVSVNTGVIPHQKLRQEDPTWWPPGETGEKTPRLFIDMARELVMDNISGQPVHRKTFEQACKFYQEGIKAFSQSLVLRFNLIRALLHLGNDEEKKNAMKLAKQTLLLDSSSFEVDSLEDVFTYDFCSTFFNFREYIDFVNQHLMDGKKVKEELIRLILASLHYYLGRSTQDFEHLKMATVLDPAFPFFRLYYARELVNRGSLEDLAEAREILKSLASNSCVFLEAYDLFKELELRTGSLDLWFRDHAAILDRKALSYIQTTEFCNRWEIEFPVAEGKRLPECAATAGPNEVEVSIILPVGGKTILARQCLDHLLKKTKGVSYEVILVDDLPSHDPPTSLAPCLSTVRVVQSQVPLSYSAARNLGAKEAKGKYLVFMRNQLLPEEGWLDSLLSEVRASSEIAVVGSKHVNLAGRIDHAGLLFSRLLHQPTLAYRGISGEIKVANTRHEFQGVKGEGMLVRQEVFLSIGGFDTSYERCYEDFDFCLKVRHQGYRVVYQPTSVMINLDEIGSYGGNAKDLERFLAAWKNKFLEDEDAFYLTDGYVVSHTVHNGCGALMLKPVATEDEQKRWLMVATVQRLAQVVGLEGAKPILLQPENWPEDVSVLQWGARLCELAGIPQQSKAFLERSLALEKSEKL